MVDAETVVGVVYVLLGVFGVVENVTTAILISTNKEMKNATYSYIVQACICDAITLLVIALLAGLMLLFPVLVNVPLCRIGGYVAAIGWYPGSYFMVMTAVTRWLQLEYPHKLVAYFRPKIVRLTIVLVYAFVGTLYTWFLYAEPAPLLFYPEFNTWAYDRTHAWGEAMAILNITVNSICAVLIALINARSCWHIHRTRRQVMNVSTFRNRQREVKLFVQCAVTGTFYIMTVVFFFVASCLKNGGFVEYLITHLIWICNHAQQPLVYMTLNAGLRQTFVKRLFLNSICGRLPLCRSWKRQMVHLTHSTDQLMIVGRLNPIVAPTPVPNSCVYM